MPEFFCTTPHLHLSSGLCCQDSGRARRCRPSLGAIPTFCNSRTRAALPRGFFRARAAPSLKNPRITSKSRFVKIFEFCNAELAPRTLRGRIENEFEEAITRDLMAIAHTAPHAPFVSSPSLKVWSSVTAVP